MGKNRQARKGEPFARCFLPKGRTAQVLYAVSVKDHEGVVKIGRTRNWRSRRIAYDNWNLARGDAVTASRAFVLTDEWLDLPRLEAAMLAQCPFPLRAGSEWFHADFDEMCEFIARFLDDAGISHEPE